METLSATSVVVNPLFHDTPAKIGLDAKRKSQRPGVLSMYTVRARVASVGSFMLTGPWVQSETTMSSSPQKKKNASSHFESRWEKVWTRLRSPTAQHFLFPTMGTLSKTLLTLVLSSLLQTFSGQVDLTGSHRHSPIPSPPDLSRTCNADSSAVYSLINEDVY